MDFYRHWPLGLAVFLAGFLLCGCNADASRMNTPYALDGVLDLRNWDFDTQGPVDLNGMYEFYWREFLSSADFQGQNRPAADGHIYVPGLWNRFEFEGEPIGSDGYATYRLRIILPERLPIIAFKFKDMATAYSVFVNGDTLFKGTAGNSAATSDPFFTSQLIDYSAYSDSLELLLQVSNFHHKKGGAWEKIILGPPQQITTMWGKRLAYDLFLIGAILIVGLYHLVLFSLRRKDSSALYFGMLCFVVVMRVLCIEERWALFFLKDVDWELFVKIEYLSGYLIVPSCALFMYSLFGEKFSPIVLRFMLVFSSLASLLVIFTDARVYSHTLPLYEAFIILSCIFAVYVLIQNLRFQRMEATMFLLGFLALFASAIIDIMDINEIMQHGQFIGPGMLAFIFSQAALLARRNAQAFTTIEDQHKVLGEMNGKYQHELAERIHAEEEKVNLEAKLARATRMEALGLLAGGVAHDLNNVLSGIVSYPDLMMMDLDKETRLYRQVNLVKQSGLKAAAIVEDLLTLTRRGVPREEVVNLNEIIRSYLQSPEYRQLRLNFPELSIQTDFEGTLLNIRGSEVHLRKTVANLVTNAAEAQMHGGRVCISTRNVYVDQPISGYEEVTEGDYIRLRIADRGIGIPSGDLEHIFEPFYTKKIMGNSGTGLGMTVVWGTVQDHEGYIDARSVEGEGTEFDLYFPVTREELMSTNNDILVDSYLGQGERILVVDDVEEQRQIASGILERLRYTVVAAASGEAAVQYLQSNRVDLLILDMIMAPGIGGLETYRRIIRLHPQIRAVIASGFSETEEVRKAQELGAGRYIKKPYTLEKIGLAIREELDMRGQ